MAGWTERANARLRMVLWLVVCASALHLLVVARAAFAGCPHWTCPSYGPILDCESVPGCGRTLTYAFDCCCTIPELNLCCDYVCVRMWCSERTEECGGVVVRRELGNRHYPGICGGDGNCVDETPPEPPDT